MHNRSLFQAIENAGINLQDSAVQLVLPKQFAFFEHKSEKQEALQINLAESKIYPAIKSGFLEIDSAQKKYNLDQVKTLLASRDKKTSFTYAISMDKQVVFSEGATSSFHINLCMKKPVYGAGEVYLKKSKDGLEVVCINNKSGLYLPKTEFLKPMKEWFKKNGFIVDKALLEDERIKLIRNDIEVRASLRW